MRIALVVLLLAASTAHADQWVTPTPVTVTSPNQKLQAVITPAKDGKSGARAAIGPKGAPGTAYTMATKWMPVDVKLFDDGSLLALDHWHRMGSGNVATFYQRDGKVRWAKTLVELIGQQLIDAADHSVSSIWWRRSPLEWSLAKDGKTVTITLFDENQLRLALTDGTPTLVVVTIVTDEPRRLFNRARALSRQSGQETEAIGLLDRAIAKDPELFEAITLCIDLLQRTNDHARAVALLGRTAPRWKTKAGYNIANVHVAWAKSLKALARIADAERILRVAVTAAPTYVNPAIALATLLHDAKRPRDADAVLSELVDRLLVASYLDTYALANVAAFYTQRKAHAKALALYLKAYKKDRVTNQFLYAQLAKHYEAMGKLALAIRINEQLLAHFQKLGSAFDMYTKQTRDELVRLRAKQQP